MSTAKDADAREKDDVSSLGEGTALERAFDRHLGNFIHLFLSMLALLVLAAATIAAFETVVRDFPQLWRQQNDYQVLHLVLQKILLVAIAAELGLLLLFHRTRTALEVVIFVIARRMVAAELSALDLMLGAVALAALIVVRFYYLPHQEQSAARQ